MKKKVFNLIFPIRFSSQVALRNLFLDINIKDAIDQSRFHHQLFPSNCEIEDHYSEVKKYFKLKKIN